MAKVFINPGHAPGGVGDPGACGNGLRESDVAAKIGKRVSDYLIAAGYETEVQQIDGLNAICNAANASGADVFVSIHCNASASMQAHGTDMPGVLVETAFITNNYDAELLVNSEDEFARAIARGITDYFSK